MKYMHRHRRWLSLGTLAGLLAAMTTPPVSAEYNPRTGRYLQRDPSGQALVLQALRHNAENPMVTVSMAYQLQFGDGMNFYEYLRSNPSIGRDPSGLTTYAELGSSVGMQSAMGGFANGFVAKLAGRNFWSGFAEGAIGGAFGGAAGYAFQAGRAGFFGSAVLGRFVEGFVEETATSFYNGTDAKNALVNALFSGGMSVVTGGLFSMNKRNVDAVETLGAAHGAGRLARKNSIRPAVGPGSLRDDLAKLWGTAPDGYDAHHMFPLAHAEKFRKAGIEPDNVIYGAWWEAADHQHHGDAYNDIWEQFLTGNPTAEQILEHGRELAKTYGLQILF